MSDFEKWRVEQGYAPTLPYFRKSTVAFYISSEAVHGLEAIAQSLNFIKKSRPSINMLLEAIGLNTLIVKPLQETERTEYVDEDGLTENICFQAGLADYNKKRPPDFYSDDRLSGGRKRSAIFLNAYISGYTSGFMEDSLTFTPSIKISL